MSNNDKLCDLIKEIKRLKQENADLKSQLEKAQEEKELLKEKIIKLQTQ